MKLFRAWKRRLAAALLATTAFLPAAPFVPQAEAASNTDVFTALAGVLGTAGMYSSYLSAIMDAGNNAYYQEQTRLYDAHENGVDRNPMNHQIVGEVMEGLVERGNYVLDIRSLPFRWNVNDSAEFNAACFPTNYITVNKGLVVGLNGNVDEIAGVLAHEMTHGIKLHAAYNYARAAAQAFGINFLGMVTGAVRPDVVGVLADYSVAKNVILPAEYEADEGGFYLAASAGFNPGGPAAAMARMDYLTKHPDTFDRSYGADPYDHPDTDKREAKLAAMMSEYSAGHVTVKDRKEILIDGQPLLSASYSTEVYDDTPEQAYLIAGGLARAFHEYTTAEAWNFRPGANGRIDYLDDNRVYEYLKDAVERNHAEADLERLVRAAYAGESASGAREKMAAAENERLAYWQERMAKNTAADKKLVERLYKNADAYNDINEPELSIEEGFNYKDIFMPRLTFVDDHIMAAIGDGMTCYYKVGAQAREFKKVTFKQDIDSIFLGDGYIGYVLENEEDPEEGRRILMLYNKKGVRKMEKALDMDYDTIRIMDKQIIGIYNEECTILNRKGVVLYQGRLDEGSIQEILPVRGWRRYKVIFDNKIADMQLQF